jgi:transposase-like protein
MANKGSSFAKYSLSFKIWLVEKYLAGEGGVETLALSNGLKSKTQLKEWIKKYSRGELTEASVDNRGCGKGSRKGRPRTKFESQEQQLEYLKLENEYLKKKLLSQGQPATCIANLWSSKNLKQD